MAGNDTPSSVMYSTLKQLKVNNREAAKLLLSDTQMHGGGYIKDRIEEKTFLFRLTHSNPGDYPESYFVNLANAAQTLCSRILRNDSEVSSARELAEYISGGPLEEMRAACKEANLDGSLLSNLVKSIQSHPGLDDGDKASATMLAYIATGCIGSPVRAKELVDGFLSSIASRGFRTEVADESSYVENTSNDDVKMALVRVVDGALDLNNMHVLSEGENGTVIGSMSTEADSINDVGPLVSKRHLRVFKDADGLWWVQGLGSTNGTTLIDGANKREIVVEAPKSERGSNPASPVPLNIGDALHLAGTTVFLAIKVA